MPTDIDPELMEKDPEKIRSMFADIAPRYDLTNTLLTASVDAIWRNRTASLLLQQMHSRFSAIDRRYPLRILDACSGTGKLGKRIINRINGEIQVFASDFCVPLLKEGTPWSVQGDPIRPFAGDLLRMPVPDETFDVVTISFGYRNLADRSRALNELHRILRPDGLLLILEFQMPSSGLIRNLYTFYFTHVLPLIGRLISRSSTDAYSYLNRSVLAFPAVEELLAEFRSHHFEEVLHLPMSFGIVHFFLLGKQPR